MKTTQEFRDRVKFYERQRGLSFRDSMQSALNEFIEEERERCAKVAESEPELEGPMPPENIEAAKLVSLEDHLRVTVRLTKANIARRIRGS
jgi:hypothetical protein